MNILVTGATGFVGRHLCSHFHQQGNKLRVLSRSADAAEALFPDAEVREWDLWNEAPSKSILEGVHAVIHLAGESVAGSWRKPGKKQEIRESRTLGTRHLVQALAETSYKPQVFVCASAIGYYGDRGEETLEEGAAPGKDFLASVCGEWEGEAAKAAELGIRTMMLRMGVVLGPEGGALKEMIPLYRKGLGGALGSGRQWWSWIHMADLAALIQHLLENPLEGPVNATAPEPVRQKEFARALGRAVRKPAILPAPAFALRLSLGEFAGELLSSRRVMPRKALASGFMFRYQILEAALGDLVK